jgi:GMP synthase-like glutamine amidotransferase
MRIHFFQHVPFEGLGSIQQWVDSRSHSLTSTRFYLDEGLPQLEDIDWLIVMGGPMSVNDESQYSWLSREKRFIEGAVRADKVVLGICLGAQLIANILGSRVYRNTFKEIGWYPVRKVKEAEQAFVLNILPQRFTAFHWHGETFDLPKGALHAVESDACMNQAFVFGNRVIGLQFHLESTGESIRALINHCSGDITADRYVQSPENMLLDEGNFYSTNQLMNRILDGMQQSSK